MDAAQIAAEDWRIQLHEVIPIIVETSIHTVKGTKIELMGAFVFRTRFQKNSNLEFFKKCEGLPNEFFHSNSTAALSVFSFFRFFSYRSAAAAALMITLRNSYQIPHCLSVQRIGTTNNFSEAAEIVEN